jgi:hypothetical protein
VRNPLGWGVLAFAGRTCAGVSPLGDLAAKEFVFFVSKFPSGLALPIPSFFVQLLEGLGPQPLPVVSCFILQAAIVAYLRGMSVEVTLLPASSSSIRGKDDHQPREGGQRAEPWLHPMPPILWGGKRAMFWLHLFGFDGFGAASNAASRRQAGRGCSSTARVTVASCTGPHCSDAARGVVQDVVCRGGGSRVLGWYCPHHCRRTGARTSSHTLRWSPPPASHRCRGGRRRW